MSRSERLFDLLQTLRRHRAPVSGARLAQELAVSLRTIYRDIATLQAQGADIEGEAGVGYVLKPGFMLPPLMLSQEEVEAILLGSQWVAKRADGPLSLAARNALAKIVAVLPADLQATIGSTNLIVAHGREQPPVTVDLVQLRAAIRAERKLDILYGNAEGVLSERTVWPFALAFFDHVQILVAWCEARRDFRHFRVDRITRAALLEQRYPRRRQALLKAWQVEAAVVFQDSHADRN